MQFNTVRPKPAPYDLQVWYAWHPVLTEKGVVVWLENVWRAYDRTGSAYYHLC